MRTAMKPKESTLQEVINNARRSIDDANPSEWSAAANKNYEQQVPDYFETTIHFSDPVHDEIQKPAHYNYGKYETIDVIVDTLGEFDAINYCHGNVLKYVIRMWHKGTPDKDIKKAIWYANKMAELLEKTKGKNW